MSPPWAGGVEAHGGQSALVGQFHRYWDSFQDAMDEIRIEPERLCDAGEALVVAMHLTAKGRRTAIAVEQRTVGVWTIRDGKVTRIRSYASLSEAFEAVGLAE